MERNSFVFYKDWMEAIRGLPDDVRLDVYESVIEYATTGNVRGLKPMANIAFNFIKTTIDRDIEKYVSIVERNRHNGSNGGRPKKEAKENPNNPMGFLETQENPKKPKKPDNDNDNDNVFKEKSSNEDKKKVVVEEEQWRKDYQIYLADVTESYSNLLKDENFIRDRERYFPNIDIKLSLEKVFKDFWSTEAGWRHKKSSKTKKIDWKGTFRNSLDQKFNQIYKQENYGYRKEKQGRNPAINLSNSGTRKETI